MKQTQIEKTVYHLSMMFRNATHSMPLPDRKGNDRQRLAYKWQVDFAYKIDAIQRGPTYKIVSEVSDVNKMIAGIKEQISQMTK